MRLSAALDIQPRDVVSFVGAGGKTSAMFRLASELAEQGWQVISTTTTRIALDEMESVPQRVGFGHGMRLPESLPDQVARHRHVFVFTRIDSDHKVRGIRPAWLDEHLVAASYLDALLVEADGSRRLSMKGPLPHEPVIPAASTIVVPVVGMDVMGKPLTDQYVYGADVIHRLTGYPLGDPISPRLVAAVLMHPQLGMKNVPLQARVTPLLNKVTEETRSEARLTADLALTDPHIDRVLLGAVRESEPIMEFRRRVGAVVLAAGESRRMGQPKLLLPWADSTMIRHVCEQVADSGAHEIVVVAGRWVDDIQRQLDGLPVRVLYNPDYLQGEMVSSLQAGLQAIWSSSDACLVVLGDLPAVSGGVMKEVVAAYFRGEGQIVAPTYRGQQGHPVLIDRRFWQAIAELPPGAVPRDLLRAHMDEVYLLEVESEAVLRDIDTPDDYRAAIQRRG